MRNAAQLVSTIGALVMAATPLAAIASTAHAEDVQSIRIKTSDLDLGRSADGATLKRRVAAAAAAICRPTGPTELARVAVCERTVHAEAEAQLHHVVASGARPAAWVVAGR